MGRDARLGLYGEEQMEFDKWIEAIIERMKYLGCELDQVKIERLRKVLIERERKETEEGPSRPEKEEAAKEKSRQRAKDYYYQKKGEGNG